MLALPVLKMLLLKVNYGFLKNLTFSWTDNFGIYSGKNDRESISINFLTQQAIYEKILCSYQPKYGHPNYCNFIIFLTILAGVQRTPRTSDIRSASLYLYAITLQTQKYLATLYLLSLVIAILFC